MERRCEWYRVMQDTGAALVQHTWPDGLEMRVTGLVPERTRWEAQRLAAEEAERHLGKRFLVLGPDGEEFGAVQMDEPVPF